jgi:hypothetical protein
MIEDCYTASDLAAWLNCSKPLAASWLKKTDHEPIGWGGKQNRTSLWSADALLDAANMARTSWRTQAKRPLNPYMVCTLSEEWRVRKPRLVARLKELEKNRLVCDSLLERMNELEIDSE